MLNSLINLLIILFQQDLLQLVCNSFPLLSGFLQLFIVLLQLLLLLLQSLLLLQAIFELTLQVLDHLVLLVNLIVDLFWIRFLGFLDRIKFVEHLQSGRTHLICTIWNWLKWLLLFTHRTAKGIEWCHLYKLQLLFIYPLNKNYNINQFIPYFIKSIAIYAVIWLIS